MWSVGHGEGRDCDGKDFCHVTHIYFIIPRICRSDSNGCNLLPTLSMLIDTLYDMAKAVTVMEMIFVKLYT